MAVTPTPGQGGDVRSNSTKSFEPFGQNWLRILVLVVASLGLPGNTTVLWLLGFRIRRNPFSVYILNLAGADSLFLACVILICTGEFAGCFDANGYLIIIFVSVLFYCAGLSLLAAISTERCLSALFPVWYRCLRPQHTSAAVSAVLWALAMVLAVLNWLYCKYKCILDSQTPVVVVVWFVWLAFLALLLCVSSLTLLLRVRCGSWRRQPPRLYGLVLLLTLVFLLCGLPLAVQVTMFNLGFKTTPSWLPSVLACMNSSMNPLIYFFLGSQKHRRGRESLKVVLQRALGDKLELGGDGRDTFHTNTQETSS